MWLRVCSNNHAPLTVIPYIIFFFKIKNCLNDDLFISCNDRIGKMLHNICISAVAMSLRWATCGPWASCYVSVLRGRATEVLVSPACCTNLPHVLVKYVLNRLFIVSKNIFLQIIYAWHQTNTQKITFMNFSFSSCKILLIIIYIILYDNNINLVNTLAVTFLKQSSWILLKTLS